MSNPTNKINWTPAMVEYLRSNWPLMNNRDLAAGLGLHLTIVRMKLYELGMKRIELEYWTEEQVAFLRANYKRIGDLELSEMFNARWFKKKGWSKKHIEKKRRYLGLKRSEHQKFDILIRNCAQGRFDNCNWAGSLGRRRLRIGTVIVRPINGYPVKLMRVKGGFRRLAHINYEKQFGPIPPRKMITFKDTNPLNCEPSNLQAVTRAEHAEYMRSTDGCMAALMSMKKEQSVRGCLRKNEALFNELMKHPEILNIKRQQLHLRRAIREKEQRV